jgi:tyrosyl-tRNA synthetase
MKFLPVDEQLARIARGTVDLVSRDELAQRLADSRKSGRPLRVKLGIDPSSPDIHVGHTVVLRKLRDFQELGHTAVVLWGTATAMVGDPTGKNKTRPTLTREEVEVNKRTYKDQVRRVLDMDRAEERENGEWFDRMSFMDGVRLSARYTVARILERDSFQERFSRGVPISVHELLYPLMQGHDSVELHADVELGGTDQLFNLLVGRELQKEAGQAPQVCVTTPLLEGLDGAQKMSKSLGNTIGVTEAPREMFGKCMSIPDALMAKYFTLLTDVGGRELEAVLAGHPRDAKVRLAREIVSVYHGAAAAGDAAAEFDRMFREGGLPDEIPEVAVTSGDLRGGTVLLALVLARAGFCKTNSDGRRLIEGGGVRVDGAVVGDPRATLQTGCYLVQSGKRHAARVVVP